MGEHPTSKTRRQLLILSRLPTKNGLLDWDCAGALAIPDIVKSLEHIHKNGTFPVSSSFSSLSHRSNHGAVSHPKSSILTSPQPDLDSKEDQNSVGACPVSDATIAALKSRVKAWTAPGSPGHDILISSSSAVRLCVFDGFLLYSKELEPVQPQMDVKLFLRVSYAKAKARREARSGYVTLEGFWEDPPGYVDKIVWPNYVEDHEWMFEDGDVEGRFKEHVLEKSGIKCQEGGVDMDMETTLKWAVMTLMRELPLDVNAK